MCIVGKLVIKRKFLFFTGKRTMIDIPIIEDDDIDDSDDWDDQELHSETCAVNI